MLDILEGVGGGRGPEAPQAVGAGGVRPEVGMGTGPSKEGDAVPVGQ
jgi:hypothetical protein